MLFSHSRHFRGTVEDGDEGGVEGCMAVGAATHIAAQDEELRAEALAEALWVGGGSGARCGGWFEGRLGVVPPEEVQEGVWFRHYALCERCCGCAHTRRRGKVRFGKRWF